MFGIDKDKIKAAFADFNQKAATQTSDDPLVNLIVKFIQDLSKAFN